MLGMILMLCFLFQKILISSAVGKGFVIGLIGNQLISLESMCPAGYSCTKYDDHVVYYKMEISEKSIPCVTETIQVDNLLHVQLFFKSLPLPLPQWFRNGRNCTLTSKSMLVNLSTIHTK